MCQCLSKAQLKKMFEYLNSGEECSFRYLIYDVMGCTPDDYHWLYETGLMGFLNKFYSKRRENDSK